MANPPHSHDPISVVIPVYNAADRLEKVVPAWGDALARLGREYEIVVVNDGSTDETPAILEKLAGGRVKYLRVLKHETRKGFGACLRTALAEVRYPLFFYTSPDYPYLPADVRKLLERIEVRDEVFKKQPDLISGCRTGQPTPAIVKWLGAAWRLLWRVAVGMQVQAIPTWLGLSQYLYGRLVGWVFGVPLADVNSAFKLYRTAFLKRVPIQSDGGFVHAELVAKATFLTSIMDEVALTPAPPSPPPVPSVWAEMWRVFKNPDFGTPPTAPAQPGDSNPSQLAPVDGSREPAPLPAAPETPAPPSLSLAFGV